MFLLNYMNCFSYLEGDGLVTTGDYWYHVSVFSSCWSDCWDIRLSLNTYFLCITFSRSKFNSHASVAKTKIKVLLSGLSDLFYLSEGVIHKKTKTLSRFLSCFCSLVIACRLSQVCNNRVVFWTAGLSAELNATSLMSSNGFWQNCVCVCMHVMNWEEETALSSERPLLSSSGLCLSTSLLFFCLDSLSTHFLPRRSLHIMRFEIFVLVCVAWCVFPSEHRYLVVKARYSTFHTLIGSVASKRIRAFG